MITSVDDFEIVGWNLIFNVKELNVLFPEYDSYNTHHIIQTLICEEYEHPKVTTKMAGFITNIFSPIVTIWAPWWIETDNSIVSETLL